MDTTEQTKVQNLIQRNQAESGEIILYQPDSSIKMEVRIDTQLDTVWLNRNQIAELFGRDVKTIGKHINNALREELESCGNPTVAKFATVHIEGERTIKRQIEYYNLDVILSVGYRVKSNRGILFRQWANSVLKEHLLRGYSVNQQLVALQERTDERFVDIQRQLDVQKRQVEFLVDIHKQPSERLFPTGCFFDAWEYVSSLVREAKERIVLIDNYCDERTLVLLSKRMKDVSCVIHTRYNAAFDADLEKHNAQYPKVEKVQLSQKEHDRFLIIDDTVYILGDSLKDLGHSLTTVLRTSFAPDVILELMI